LCKTRATLSWQGGHLRSAKSVPVLGKIETEDEMSIGIVLHNNERTNPNDLFVSVNDLNAAGGPMILANQRINVDQTYSLPNVQEDGNGNGNIAWTARTVDGAASKQDTVSVTDGQMVEVASW
jgi:hypothetical protein